MSRKNDAQSETHTALLAENEKEVLSKEDQMEILAELANISKRLSRSAFSFVPARSGAESSLELRASIKIDDALDTLRKANEYRRLWEEEA